MSQRRERNEQNVQRSVSQREDNSRVYKTTIIEKGSCIKTYALLFSVEML